MTKPMLAAAALLALAVLASPARAQPKESLDLAGSLFERSGLAVQLQSLPGQFEAGLPRGRGEVPENVLAALADAGRISYAVSALRADVVPVLARRLSAEDMRQVLAWLESDAGRRVTHAEEAGSGATRETLRKYLEREKSRPPDAKRTRLLADLAETTHAVDVGASFVEAIWLGVAVGIDASRPEEERIGADRLRERLHAVMPPDKLRAEVGASVPAMSAYTYRDIGDADLAAYLEFNRSPAGKRYNDAIAEALAVALGRAGARVGELVQGAQAKQRI